MDDADECVVPGCTNEVEYDSPGKWCEEHWRMWWEWPPDKPQPDWMPDDEDDDADT